ncbi:hypothetical protein [Gordonia sp. DT101]|uniref:hypothetical protein n=1 Tax=Gordonia sp. DT101 TaxID=3416545 RepID=UPI003CF1F1EA
MENDQLDPATNADAESNAAALPDPTANADIDAESTEPAAKPLEEQVAHWKSMACKNGDRAKANAAAATRVAELESEVASLTQAAATATSTATAQLRHALITTHGLDDATAGLLTASDADGLITQLRAVTALRGNVAQPSAPLAGSTAQSVPDPSKQFVSTLFNPSAN